LFIGFIFDLLRFEEDKKIKRKRRMNDEKRSID